MGLLTRWSSFARVRASLKTLDRIAVALERQNALFAAAHPDAARRVESDRRRAEVTGPPLEDTISYVDPQEMARFEAIFQRIYHATGREPDEAEVLAVLDAEREPQGR